MRYLVALLTLSALTGCGGALPAPLVLTSADLARDISSETVALTTQTAEGMSRAFCSGVWVGPAAILTAGHCVKDENTVSPIGLSIAYIVQAQVTGYRVQPRGAHVARVAQFDNDRDLALLVALEAVPLHKIAYLAPTVPAPGEPLYFIGMPRGFYWTFMTGSMSGVMSQIMDQVGPWLQVTAPILPGMSGSGAFDSRGRLVGICSFSMGAPNIAFYVHLDHVRLFLG